MLEPSAELARGNLANRLLDLKTVTAYGGEQLVDCSKCLVRPLLRDPWLPEGQASYSRGAGESWSG